MAISQVVILLVTGLGVGFAGGLLGLGGAFIMTPVQYAVYTSMSYPPELAIKMAFGTSLLVILPTAASGTWRHSRAGEVFWKAAIIMGGVGLVSAFAGATLSTHLPGAALKTAFGGVVIASGLRMLTARLPEADEKPRNNPWLWAAWAVLIGLVSGILGVGGGVVAIPVMMLALKFRMHNAVATSLAMIIFTSIGGVAGYIVNGLGAADLPAYSLGYIHLPTWLLLTVTSVGMAQIGALTAHRLPAKQLRYIFLTVLLYLGLRMLGLFDWLGLPL